MGPPSMGAVLLLWSLAAAAAAAADSHAGNASHRAWARYRLWRGRKNLFQETKAYFYQGVFGALNSWKGCYDMESLLGPLKAVVDRSSRELLLIDVGANQGQSSTAMLDVLAEQRKYDIHTDDEQNCMPRKLLKLMMFEPDPANFAVLQQEILKRQRLGLSTILKQAAVSNRVGREILHGRGEGGSLSAQVTVSRAQFNASHQVEVDVLSLDWLMNSEQIQDEIFLLKIDAEGFDPIVLQGASDLLRKQRIRYLFFEVDKAWDAAGHGITLGQTVEELFEMGYLCFLIHSRLLLPMYSFWWHPKFNQYTWANAFCASEFDPDLYGIYVSYANPDVKTAFWYAAVELQHTALPPAKFRGNMEKTL